MTFHSQIRGGSVYAQTARFDGSARALTEVELRQHCPSVFAVSAHESRSARFAPIPTIEILRGLSAEGFSVVGAKQATTRVPGKADFTKHLLRLRRLDATVTEYSVQGTVAEILLKNANDGTAAYELMAGLFRILCLNSLVAQTSTLESIKIRHSGNPLPEVIDGTFKVIGAAKLALAAPEVWGGVNLSTEERDIMARAVHVARFGEAEEGGVIRDHAITPQKLLGVRREGDRGTDLWTTANVLQENAIRGGLRGLGRDANNNVRRVRTREVKGIDQDVKINRAVWLLATEMAKLKNAPAI